MSLEQFQAPDLQKLIHIKKNPTQRRSSEVSVAAFSTPYFSLPFI